MRDHGGNLDWAIGHYGGSAADWIDLSTGVNRVPYPVPAVSPEAWTALPTRSAMDGLLRAARTAYRTKAPIVALAGAQAAIQLVPRLSAPGRARVLSPTYNEHAASLRAAGWQVEEVTRLADLEGTDLAIVVNPNNPDGQTHTPDALLSLVGRVGRLVVDESFGDITPALSLAPMAGREGLVVLRSFGKFYGLAGLRLGFALGAPGEIAAMEAMSGPWPISGAAIEVGTLALADAAWADATAQRLAAEAWDMDALARGHGWQPIGGTDLFRLYDTTDATAAQAHLARHQIWSRLFPYSPRWLRLGLPGAAPEWARLATALEG
ncbi:threonine-phosphate decarboxylase [mine drainage metagenome]|uniref:threonine-phosphate decarboxylase n=1 Tax=mine drainage metagenome TaxID=410659 RepID=A0A1J5PT42_9ZZZZ